MQSKTPVRREARGTRMAPAASNSNTPLARTKGTRIGTPFGSICAMAEVLTKWPSPVNTNTSATPIRPQRIPGMPARDSARYGSKRRVRMIATFCIAGCCASSLSANDVDVEVRIADDAPQTHPQGQKHLRAARVGDVAKVNDAGGLPAEPLAKPVCDLAFGGGVVAANEQVVVARNARRSNHDFAV